MSIWSRIANVFHADRLRRELDEELESHLSEAVEMGRTPSDARKALGPALRHREASRDIRVFAWLDSLRADIIFGWRQLRKYKVSSAAAVLSLGLAIGSCTAAFRLVDALLLRPLPVTSPEQLYVVERQSIGDDGNLQVGASSSFPLFRMMKESAQGQAQFLAISYAERGELTYGPGQEPEKAYLQYVSGGMFESFGLRPVAGRLLTDADDLTPGAHPYAVISYDYWTRRFGQDLSVVGRTFRMGLNLYEIIGVVGKGFTGAEPGTMVDVFIPAMMKGQVIHQPY
jgi:putative ABC transport system permease protein